MELNEKETHCIARLLQSAIFGKSLISGCQFCKFRCDGDELSVINSMRNRLYDETGVDLRLGSDKRDELPFSDFPYKRFLKAANDDVINYYRVFFTA